MHESAFGTSLHSPRCKKFGRYWVYSGQKPVLGLIGYAANDPKWTLGFSHLLVIRPAEVDDLVLEKQLDESGHGILARPVPLQLA